MHTYMHVHQTTHMQMTQCKHTDICKSIIFSIIFNCLCFTHLHTTGITQGPSNVSYIPGQTPLPIELTCTITGDFVTWRVNGTTYTLSNLMANPPPLAGHSANGNNTLINIPVNNTEYECVSNIPGLPGIPSYSAFVYFAGECIH